MGGNAAWIMALMGFYSATIIPTTRWVVSDRWDNAPIITGNMFTLSERHGAGEIYIKRRGITITTDNDTARSEVCSAVMGIHPPHAAGFTKGLPGWTDTWQLLSPL